jgi:hypothetical protein
MTLLERKKDIEKRLLKISGDEYLNGVIPLANSFIAAKNRIRIDMLLELINEGVNDSIILDKLEVEYKNERELKVIDEEIMQMYREGVTFLNI